MNFDPNMMSALMFQTHAITTLNNPLIYNKIKGKLSKIKPELLQNIEQKKQILNKKTNDANNTNSTKISEFDILLQECFNEFSNECNLRGTVHYNPLFWFQVFKHIFIMIIL